MSVFDIIRRAPLLKPRLHQLDFGALRGFDLLGEAQHAVIDAVLGEDHVGHLDGLFVVRDHHHRELHVCGVHIGGRGCRGR
jgi:hypothetical protein